MTYSVLFVCLGNICRSPLAEAAFREEARRLNLDVIVDSAGTGDWHVGAPPDPRAQAVARKNGVDISILRGRQVKPADFRRFTHIVALDEDNLVNLRRLAPADAMADLSLLLGSRRGPRGPAGGRSLFRRRRRLRYHLGRGDRRRARSGPEAAPQRLKPGAGLAITRPSPVGTVYV